MKQIRLLLVGAAALSLFGCGGGGSAPAGTSGNFLANGRAALNSLASGTQPTSSQSLQSALDLFQQATQQDPNSSEAHWGMAVCLAGIVAQGVDGQTPSSQTVVSQTTASKAAKKAATRDDPLPPAPPGSTGSGSSGGSAGLPTLPPPPTSGDYPPAPPGHTDPIKPVEQHHVRGLFWNLSHGLSNPYSLLQMLAPVSDLRLGLLAYMGYNSDNQSVGNRQDMLAKLGTVLDNLHKVEADPNFTTTLPDPDWNGKTVTIGLPEVYLFDAYVNSLRTEIALSLAYVRDPGVYQPVPEPITGTVGSGNTGSGVELPPAPPIFTKSVGISKGRGTVNSPYVALDKNGDGKLTPDEYLPSSPYLTLRDASYLQTAQQSMLALVDAETKGIAGVLARPADGAFLIPHTAEVQKALADIRDNVLPIVKQAANGAVTLDIPHYTAVPLLTSNGGGIVPQQGNGAAVFVLYPVGGGLPPAPPIVTTEKLTINLAAWFATPPKDLKVFAPTYVLTADGWVDFTKTTSPDQTFGGLFPNGLPTDLQL